MTAKPPPATPWPQDLHFDRAAKLLRIIFESGEQFDLPAEYLRVMSPSAEVAGHGADRPPPVTGKQNVGFAGAEAVGNYAVRIQFDDGHDTGLYTWDYLYRLGADRARLWAEYLERAKR